MPSIAAFIDKEIKLLKQHLNSGVTFNTNEDKLLDTTNKSKDFFGLNVLVIELGF